MFFDNQENKKNAFNIFENKLKEGAFYIKNKQCELTDVSDCTDDSILIVGFTEYEINNEDIEYLKHYIEKHNVNRATFTYEGINAYYFQY